MNHLKYYALFESNEDDIISEIKDILANISDDGFKIDIRESNDDLHPDSNMIQIDIYDPSHKNFSPSKVEGGIVELVGNLEDKCILDWGMFNTGKNWYGFIIENGKILSRSNPHKSYQIDSAIRVYKIRLTFIKL